jgi:hypothetical protein
MGARYPYRLPPTTGTYSYPGREFISRRGTLFIWSILITSNFLNFPFFWKSNLSEIKFVIADAKQGHFHVLLFFVVKKQIRKK